jgi:hypothetical protein
MQTSQFEAIKLAIKQDKEGYVLNLRMHPDDVPEEILRDFVGARYQVVMVRLADDNSPMERNHSSSALVSLAGMLCRNTQFGEFLIDTGNIFDNSEESITKWMKDELQIQSRKELATNKEAALCLKQINEEFQKWKQNV